ncbi:hypothetical protein OCU04_004372 [Sclerotinia nivalis]|uniref:Integrase catalytic domain-containing protein n=1 Tax=Sclerotinia nivalis TaxID=352851 RepID=A0A9X0DNF9_9HELO|nr:hypothetical protein OCU04_004372 [Sclerotinia nivalis]
MIERLSQFCKHYQLHSKSLGRFRFTIKNDIDFNYLVILDIFYIDGKPVLHLVDEAISYNAAIFLKDMFAKTVWNSVRKCWIDTYLGPPDYFIYDAGTNFSSKEFKQNTCMISIEVCEVPVEAHNSIGKVERYYTSLRCSYEIIQEELKDEKLDKEIILQMAVKAVNDTANPKGLVSTLLVFGVYSRMILYDVSTSTMMKRVEAVRTAMKEIREIYVRKSIQDVLGFRNGSVIYDILNLPFNLMVQI